MSSTLTKRPALLVAVCILAAALTGMLLGRVTVSDAAPGADPRPVVEPITPCRILETRGPGSGGPTGVPSAGQVGPGQTLTLQVAGAAGQGGCAVANGLVGAVLNMTAVNATADTFLTVFPCDAPRPNASTLNPFPQRITFNSASVRLSAAGTVCIFNNAGAVDVIADVTGIMYNHNHLVTTIPSGTTVTGVDRWDLDANVVGSDFRFYVQLPGLAPVALTDANVNFAPATGVADADATCTGSATNPTAPSGKVCIYIQTNGGSNTFSGLATNSNPATRAFQVRWQATTANSDTYLDIVWAYTAP